MATSIKALWQSNLSLPRKLLRTPLRLIPKWIKVKIATGYNKGFLWIIGSQNHSFWLGNFEKDKQEKIFHAVAPGSCVWDIGANVGFYTLLFSRAVGKSGKIYSFEPLPRNLDYLLQHIRINRLQNAEVFAGALSDGSEIVFFSSGLSSSVGKIVSSDFLRVQTHTIDGFCSSVSDSTPDLIKIDVEGSEAAVLKGGVNLLEKHVPRLWIALHGDQAQVDCLDILSKLGYTVFDLDGNEIKEFTPGLNEIRAEKR